MNTHTLYPLAEIALGPRVPYNISIRITYFPFKASTLIELRKHGIALQKLNLDSEYRYVEPSLLRLQIIFRFLPSSPQALFQSQNATYTWTLILTNVHIVPPMPSSTHEQVGGA